MLSQNVVKGKNLDDCTGLGRVQARFISLKMRRVSPIGADKEHF